LGNRDGFGLVERAKHQSKRIKSPKEMNR